MVIVNPNTMAHEPIGISFYGSHMDLQPGESPRAWQQRQLEASRLRQTQSAPTPAEPECRAAQDANTKELKAFADDTAKLRAAVDAQSPAAPPSEPAAKRTGFASRIKVARAFGGKHPQKSE